MWKTVKISEVATFVRGLTYSKKDEVDSGGLAVLRATNLSLEQRIITYDDIRYIQFPEKLNEDKLTRVGDLLMCTASGSKSHLGKVALVTEDLGMAFGGFIAALRCNSSCNPKFLFYILISNFFMEKLSSISEGANINNLKFSQIKDFHFQLPPLAEQQRIVAKLDATFAGIDEAISFEINKKRNVERLIAKILNSSFENISSENSKPIIKVAKFENGDRGKNYPSKKYQIDEGVPFVNAGDLSIDGEITTDGMVFISEERFNLLGAGKFRLNDILFCLRGSLGKSALNRNILRGAIASSLVIIRAKEDVIVQEYLYAFLRSDTVKEYIKNTATGTAQPNLSAKIVGNYKLPVPTLDTQKKIVRNYRKVIEQKKIFQKNSKKKINDMKLLKRAVLAQQLQSQAV